jgi:hypothetical protein
LVFHAAKWVDEQGQTLSTSAGFILANLRFFVNEEFSSSMMFSVFYSTRKKLSCHGGITINQ